MSTLLLIIITAIALLTAYCSHQDPNDDPAFAPEVNPHPKYFVTVKGHVDSILSPNLSLHWIATYYTRNPKCDYDVNPLEGISSYRTREIHKDINLKSNDYELKLPIDYFLPGECHWSLQAISYQTNVIGPSPILVNTFTDNKTNAQAQMKVSISCPKGVTSCKYKEPVQYNDFLSRTHSYTYQLNIVS